MWREYNNLGKKNYCSKSGGNWKKTIRGRGWIPDHADEWVIIWVFRKNRRCFRWISKHRQAGTGSACHSVSSLTQVESVSQFLLGCSTVEVTVDCKHHLVV